MFDISSKKVDFEKENTLIKRNINLDENLDCFILISTNDSNFWDLLLNNILEFLIDKISKNNTYNDFSIALENINSFVKTWKIDWENELKIDMTIWLLNNNNYIFSNLWKSSCYLINQNSEVLELTNKKENKKEFNFISSWELKNNEIVVSCTKRLLNYLSTSDLIDGLVLSEDIKVFNKNIKNILLSELLKENVLISSLKYISEEQEKEVTKLDVVKQNLLKWLDNKIIQTIIWYFLVLKDKINASSKIIKSVVFLVWITIAVVFLYTTISAMVSIATQNEEKEATKDNLIKAKSYIRIASENVANADVFELNIKNAEEILAEAEKNQIYLNDIEKINDDINILKKQFNKIEVFEEDPDSVVFESDFENAVKVVKNNLKPYIITKKWVFWPIIANSTPKSYTFSSLEENENFVDATFMWEEMYLLTSSSKVVQFSKNWYFNYIDVTWQQTWEKATEIDSFWQNLYLIWENNQIYKHPLYLNKFKSWEWYLTQDDVTQIGDVLSVCIDWWFYILKSDLSVIKFYNTPYYRIEKIVINKLPKNYSKEDSKSVIDMKTRNDLNYVYMLLNNKIWIFKPNTTDYKSTKSLTYIWQIEWSKEKIIDFSINHDWEIVILNKKWLFKVEFEISDDRLIIR